MENHNTKVDFKYKFGTPHRLCISMPESSKKCLLDCSENGLTVSWSDDDLTKIPLGAFYGPKIQWYFYITVEENDIPIKSTHWQRLENRLPALYQTWKSKNVEIKLTVVSSKNCDIFKFHAVNNSLGKTKLAVIGKTKDLAFNSYWIDKESKYNALFAHYGDKSDRVLFFTPEKVRELKSCSNLDIVFELDPKEEKDFFIIRPHKLTFDFLDKLQNHNWQAELDAVIEVWKKLYARVMKVEIPDKVVEDAYYACFGDIFITRELSSGGFMAGLAGTDLYRCLNGWEPTIAAIVLDHSGMFLESEYVLRAMMSFQDEVSGRWDDYRSWGHDIWWVPGGRVRWIKEHYQYTKDKKMLSANFNRILKHVRWSHLQREKTKILNDDGSKPITWGLLPRGMGDGGLMDGDDYYGFYTVSNIWHCYIIKVGFWAAEELNLIEEKQELKIYHDDAVECTINAIRNGAIREKDGTRWIPGAPQKTSGSRYGALNAVYPCELLDPFDELVTGTLKYLEKQKSEGGIPIDLGWLKGGLWVAMALDNLAYAHIAREEYDEAADYLYPTLNHGTPLFTWCEERLPEPNSTTVLGDVQHTWTPYIVTKFIRDSLLFEKNNELHVASVTNREWLHNGLSLGLENAHTHFGIVNFKIYRHGDSELVVDFLLKPTILPEKIVIHIRIPELKKRFSIKSQSGIQDISVKENQLIITKYTNKFTIKLEIS